jgi:hypothetical protein
MRVTIKLISFLLLLLSSISYTQIITSSTTINYLFEDNSYSSQKDFNITVLDKSQNGDALSMIKTDKKRYIEDNSTIEVEFSIVVTINRDISDLIIADDIAEGFVYKEGTLLLNGVAPNSFLLLDSAWSLSIGDVKEGEIYRLSYITQENAISSD